MAGKNQGGKPEVDTGEEESFSSHSGEQFLEYKHVFYAADGMFLISLLQVNENAK